MVSRAAEYISRTSIGAYFHSARESRKLVLIIVAIALLLDNMLLTTVGRLYFTTLPQKHRQIAIVLFILFIPAFPASRDLHTSCALRTSCFSHASCSSCTSCVSCMSCTYLAYRSCCALLLALIALLADLALFIFLCILNLY